MGPPSTGRVLLVCVSVLALLVTGGLGVLPTPTVAAASARVESAWRASVGTGGGNGSATVRAFDTARGSVILSLRRLTPSARYAVVIRRGACGSLGTQVTAVGTFTATTSGALSASVSLMVAQVAAVRNAAAGTSRVSLVAGTGTRARCGTLAKSLAVTPQIWFGRPAEHRATQSGRPTTRRCSRRTPRGRGSPAGRRCSSSIRDSVMYQTSAAELRRVIDALKARQIRVAIEWYALTPKGGCGVASTGSGLPPAQLLSYIRRVASLGGTVNYVVAHRAVQRRRPRRRADRVPLVHAAGRAGTRRSGEGRARGVPGHRDRSHRRLQRAGVDRLREGVDHRLRGRRRDGCRSSTSTSTTRSPAGPTAPRRSRRTSAVVGRGSGSSTPLGHPRRPTKRGSREPRRTSARSRSRELARPTMPSSRSWTGDRIASFRRRARRR